jgi:streptomycin 6-kinase
VGDPAFDLTQHSLNCVARVERNPAGTIGRMAELCGVEAGRVTSWMFARTACGLVEWKGLAWKLAATRG